MSLARIRTDQPEAVSTLSEQLRAAGYEVECVSTAQECTTEADVEIRASHISLEDAMNAADEAAEKGTAVFIAPGTLQWEIEEEPSAPASRASRAIEEQPAETQSKYAESLRLEPDPAELVPRLVFTAGERLHHARSNVAGALARVREMLSSKFAAAREHRAELQRQREEERVLRVEQRRVAAERAEVERLERERVERETAEESLRQEQARRAREAQEREVQRLALMKQEEERRRAYELQRAEQARAADEARRAEEVRTAQQRALQETRAAEQQRAEEAARVAAETRAAEKARLAEEARVAQEARLAEESRTAQEARVREQEAETARRREEEAARRAEVQPAFSGTEHRFSDTRAVPSSAGFTREVPIPYDAEPVMPAAASTSSEAPQPVVFRSTSSRGARQRAFQQGAAVAAVVSLFIVLVIALAANRRPADPLGKAGVSTATEQVKPFGAATAPAPRSARPAAVKPNVPKRLTPARRSTRRARAPQGQEVVVRRFANTAPARPKQNKDGVKVISDLD